MGRPAAPFIAPVTGDIEQRLAQVARAITHKADINSTPMFAALQLLAPDRSVWQLSVDASGALHTAMVAGNNPTLDLSFMTPGVLDPRVTFGRAGTGTYFDATGTMQTAAANVPRWDYDPVTLTLRGLLIEESRTNLLLWSTDFTNSAWQLFDGATKGPVITGPGGSAGMTLNFDAQVFSQMYQSVTGYPAGTTLSIWARANASSQFMLRFSVDGNSPVFNLTPQWQRFSSVTVSSSNTNIAIQNVGATAGSIDISMPQLEQGAFPTSYIPTTGAVAARAADVATLASIPGRNTAAESFQAEALFISSQNLNARIVAGSANQIEALGVNGSLLLGNMNDNAGSLSTANGFTLWNVIKIASSWTAPNVASLCMNGGAVASAASFTNGFAGLSTIRFLGDSVAADSGNGYIRRFRYWPRVLSNAEMQSVTT